MEKQFDKQIKCFQSDWGGEFRSLTPFFEQQGIIHRLSCPHTPEQNGRAYTIKYSTSVLGRCVLNCCILDKQATNEILAVQISFRSPFTG